MKVEAITLLLVASLALVAAKPVDNNAPSSIGREERSRKDSAKLRILEAALTHSPSGKERRITVPLPRIQGGGGVAEEPPGEKTPRGKPEQSNPAPKPVPSTTISTATTSSTTTKPKSEFSLRLEKQRTVADQALRERLMRHTGPQKDHHRARNSPTPGATKGPQHHDVQETSTSATTIPPVVYVPLSDVQDGKKGPSISPMRFAPYVPAFSGGVRRAPWPFAAYFPLLINDPYQALIGSGPLFEYGQEADVCRPKPIRDLSKMESSPQEAEVAMEGSGYVTKVVVRGGGVAIAGPGGVATAGRGGTAIVGPGGVAYTRPGALAVVGPGGKVVSQGKKGDIFKDGEENLTLERLERFGGVVVARGPVVYYDDSEDSNESEVH